MKIKLSSAVLFFCLLNLVRVNLAHILKAAAASHNLTKHAVDVNATTRHDISYNLDLVHQNGSSALMYSQRKC